MDDRAPFPHCDTRVLHAPAECTYCAQYPDLQALREAWGIASTGHRPVGDQLPCPADRARPPDSGSDHRRWPGNRATPRDDLPVSGGYSGGLPASRVKPPPKTPLGASRAVDPWLRPELIDLGSTPVSTSDRAKWFPAPSLLPDPAASFTDQWADPRLVEGHPVGEGMFVRLGRRVRGKGRLG